MSLLSKFLFSCFVLGMLTVSVAAQPRPNSKPKTTQANNQEKASALFEEGQNAHAAGKLEDAIKLYSQALALDATLWQAEYQRAFAYYSLQKFSEAQGAIKNVLEQLKEFSDTPELRQTTAKVESLHGDIATAQQQFAEAETAYRHALELDAKSKRAQLGLAQLFINENKLPEAISAAQAAISAGEDSALIFALLGNAQLRSKQFDAALNSLTEALRREPNNAQALRDRAEVFLARNDVPHAIADLQTLLAQEKNVAISLRLASLYRATKQYDQAINLYQQIIAADAANQDANTALAEVMVESGKAENAIAQLESLLKASPSRADLRSQLAVLLIPTQPEKALEQYELAAQQEPNNLNHRIGIGSALVKLKKFDEALARLRPLLSQQLPEESQYTVRANIATASFEQKEFPSAAREYIWMLNYLSRKGEQKKAAVTTYLLGVCFDRFGDFEQALKAYQQFLSLATPEQQLEVEKVKLRLPSLQRQIAQGQGIKKKK